MRTVILNQYPPVLVPTKGSDCPVPAPRPRHHRIIETGTEIAVTTDPRIATILTIDPTRLQVQSVIGAASVPLTLRRPKTDEQGHDLGLLFPLIDPVVGMEVELELEGVGVVEARDKRNGR